VLLAGHVEVGDNAFVSGNCVVHQFVRIGRLVMVRGMTALGKDVVPFALVDQSNTVRALNKLGLRRAGVAPPIIDALEHAFREVFRSGRPLFQSLEMLERAPMAAEVREMVDFIQASKRGVCLWYSTQVQRMHQQAADEGEL
jgi:UDP-N-acetylglucosamine acyltransferase